MQGNIPIVSHLALRVDLATLLAPFSKSPLLQSPTVVSFIQSGFGNPPLTAFHPVSSSISHKQS